MNKKYKIVVMPKINNSGQILLIVTVSLAILLGIGLSISNQTLSSISRTSRTDSLQKVTAAAEGGLEKYLLLPDNQLEAKVSANSSVEAFPASNTRALLVVERITGSGGLTFPEVGVGQVANFWFSNNPATQQFSGQETCLKITADNGNSAYMLNVVVKNTNQSQFSRLTPFNAVYDATSSNEYFLEKYVRENGSFISPAPVSCGTDRNSFLFKNAALVRIHPLKESIVNLKIEVVNSTVSGLENVTQGYKITSTGEFSSGDDKTTRKITASKFLDAPANVFDFTAFLDY